MSKPSDQPEGVMRVYVAMPCHKAVEFHTALCFGRLMYWIGKEGGKCGIELAGGQVYPDSILPRGRSRLVKFAIEKKATHILWLDSDMIFPAVALAMLARWDEPFVAANCTARWPPYDPTARPHENRQIWSSQERAKEVPLEVVQYVGLAVALTETSLFERVEEPWFAVGMQDGKWVGEDIYFCDSIAYALGVYPMIDHELSLGIRHIGSIEADWALSWAHRPGSSTEVDGPITAQRIDELVKAEKELKRMKGDG